MKSSAFIILLFLTVFSPVYAEPQLLDRVAAVVNGEVITESEMDTYLRPIYQQLQAEPQPREAVEEKLRDIRNKLLNQLIEDKLVYQEASKLNIQVDPAEVENEVEQMKRQTPKDKDFDEILEMQGLSMKDLKERVKRQIMIRRLHDQEVRAKIVVSPVEVEEYYRAHLNEFANEELIKVRSLTIRKSPEAQEKGLTDENAMNKIKDFRNRISSGENFSALVKQYSEDTRAKNGGTSDWIKRGEMNPEIDKAIFETDAGKMTEIIESPMGYHLFQVTDRQTARQRSFDEVRDEAQAIVYRKKFDERFSEWMLELKRNAYISIR